jgi:hypothetical protein
VRNRSNSEGRQMRSLRSRSAAAKRGRCRSVNVASSSGL